MSHFGRNIRPIVDIELSLAAAASARGRSKESFAHLERAHVLGQASTSQHIRAHWHMLVWAWRERNAHEAAGQMLRLVGAATKTAVGLVPAGNTGGANVSPFKRLPLAPDLEALIIRAKSQPEKPRA
ncbi:MAG: DUF3703 domain-containing protein [Burkholderiaceae bacterium]